MKNIEVTFDTPEGYESKMITDIVDCYVDGEFLVIEYDDADLKMVRAWPIHRVYTYFVTEIGPDYEEEDEDEDADEEVEADAST